MNGAAVQIDGVTFTYPDSDGPAIRDARVTLDEGRFALVIGPTGAGKSTLLRTVNGLVPHFSGGTFKGRVTVQDRDTIRETPRRLADAVAFVPQDPGASFVLDRVEDEIAYGMENLGTDPTQMRRRVEEMLDLMDLEPLRSRSVRTLSGGERQRVAIAASLAAGPRILVLDEPTSQLDPQAAENVVAALQRLVHDQGMTVLLAEHRLERVAGFVDVAIGVVRGKVGVGSPADEIARLPLGPPVAELGRLVGWNPVPLTVREARDRGGKIGSPVAGHIGSAPGEAIAELRKVEAKHGPNLALRDLDLTVAEGEIVTVMGRNGAGKTTLLRTIAGVHTPARGTVSFRGTGSPRPGVDTAMCPQEAESVLFRESAREEVATTLAARRGPVPDTPEEWLERLGVSGLVDRHPRDVSVGQRLLISIASIAATGAPLLLLDEPTRGLDPDTKRRLVRFVRNHAAGGGAAIIATHDVELAAAAATRVVMLAGGELIADGPTAAVLGDSHVFAPQMTRAFGPGWLTPEQVSEAFT